MKEVSYGIIPFLFTKKGVFILLYRSNKYTNIYNFVKGKPIAKDKSIKHTVVREVKEEIGIKIKLKELFDSELIVHTNPKKDIGLYMFSFEAYKKFPLIIAQKEIYELQWFPISNLPIISNNQKLFVTDIQKRFDKIHHLILSKRIRKKTKKIS